jgi:peptide subunit release factor RF-3
MMDKTIDDLIDTISDIEEKISIEKAKLAYAMKVDSLSVGWIEAMKSRIQRFEAHAKVHRFRLALARSLFYVSGIIPDQNWN